MGWDSNPRYPCGHAGFQDRCLKPLGHPSGIGSGFWRPRGDRCRSCEAAAGSRAALARRLLHIGQLRFFDEAIIPDRLYYISAFRVFEQEGLPALLHLLRREVQVRAAIFLVFDRLPVIEEAAASAASSRSSSMTCRPRHPQKEILAQASLQGGRRRLGQVGASWAQQ